MLTVAYLANQFPSAVEPYVADEIVELESRGVRVIATSVRKSMESTRAADIVLLPISISTILRAAWLCATRCMVLAPLVMRIAFRGTEGPWRRLKALVHTFLGACLAIRLEGNRVQHVHAHHGYFGSWVGMTAAKLMGAGFSFTLHGSDLLLHGAFLDTKLSASNFCITVSEYNRRYIVERYPWAEDKTYVSRLGVRAPNTGTRGTETSRQDLLTILAVGRLHAVKDHAFLVRACARLLKLDIRFKCSIAGEGSERSALESLIRQFGLTEHVRLLGHVEHGKLALLYEGADLVVLTSRSEGIPLVLMEAMAHGKLVLAPAITGIPELVISGKTGFLYQTRSIQDFVDQLLFIRSVMSNEIGVQGRNGHSTDNALLWIQHAARVHVFQNFNRSKNLQNFADLFLSRVAARDQSVPDENLVLQQI
jgi:colanic acid/amylovoran biosynthesis glycosyltransferase